MGSYQLGSGVGTAVGPAPDDTGTIGDHLGPGTAAGQAMILVAVAFLILLVTIGRESSGVVGKVGRVIEFVVIVTAASAVGQWAGRQYASQWPNAPMAAGVRFDL